eukprot:scaffold65_cov353-Prasinococcus_capsulatus_cf.AAC.13
MLRLQTTTTSSVPCPSGLLPDYATVNLPSSSSAFPSSSSTANCSSLISGNLSELDRTLHSALAKHAPVPLSGAE